MRESSKDDHTPNSGATLHSKALMPPFCRKRRYTFAPVAKRVPTCFSFWCVFAPAEVVRSSQETAVEGRLRQLKEKTFWSLTALHLPSGAMDRSATGRTS